jgi:(1->4)-alpha-D-glucan 1-alpha-D-glucosylmutase
MVHTRWTRPNLAHEQALMDFVESILSPRKSRKFLADFLAFHASVAFFGMINSLGQTLLKIACPGVPDFYQGSELWDLRLVDPDNRRPVDFEYWMNSLNELRRQRRDPVQQVTDLLAHWRDGRIKLWLIHQALRFRSQHLSLFLEGQLLPLRGSGSRSDCAVSFLRSHNHDSALAVVPRWLAHAQSPSGHIPSPEFWGDTLLHLPAPAPLLWRNVLTGERIAAARADEGVSVKLGDILRHFPVALLTAEPSRSAGLKGGFVAPAD